MTALKDWRVSIAQLDRPEVHVVADFWAEDDKDAKRQAWQSYYREHQQPAKVESCVEIPRGGV
jgi:hypothetical protein